MTTFLQYAVNGLLVGAVFALIALGFSLVWGILNIINLAHAAFIMLGAYFTWVLVTQAGLDPLLCLPVRRYAIRMKIIPSSSE